MNVILATILAVTVIGFMLFNNKNMRTYNQYTKRMKKLQESISDFTATQKYSNQNMAIAINKDEKKLAVSIMKRGNPVPLTYTFKDIIDCEVIEYKVVEDDNSINKQKAKQNMANVLGDTVGQVLGELVGDEEERINRIDLKISFNDSQNPSVLLNFLFWEVKKDSDEYIKASADASKWHGIINNIIIREAKCSK